MRMMAPMTRLCATILIVLFLAPAGASAQDTGPGETLVAGNSLASFRLKTLNPEASGLDMAGPDDVLGKTPKGAAGLTVVSFFANWCKPCMKELPLLERLRTQYAKDGLSVLVVSIDPSEDVEKARALVHQFKLTMPVVTDRFKVVQRRLFAGMGDAVKLPTVAFVRGDGKILDVKSGYGEDGAEALEKRIKEYLKVQ